MNIEKAESRRKVAYVIYNERPMCGLIKGQVIDMLQEVKRRNTLYDITVIAIWQPWIRWRYGKQLD